MSGVKWFTYMYSEKQPDTPYEAIKGGTTYWWSIAVELPSYETIEWATVLTLAQAKEYWLSEGYALPEPPEVM